MRYLIVLLLSVLTFSARAAVPCENVQVFGPKLLSDICWDCVFPIKVVGKTLGTKTNKTPPASTNQPLCVCKDDGISKPGFVSSFNEPFRIFESQRNPACISTLGGLEMPGVSPLYLGNTSDGTFDGGDKTFLHYTLFVFPLLQLMDLLTIPTVNKDGMVDFDILLLSVFDPTAGRSDLATFAHPETIFMSTLSAACPADAIAATAGWPIEALKWCYGSWGVQGSPSLHHTGGSATIEEHNFFMARALATSHRRGIERRTMGDDALCKGKIAPFIEKQQYSFTTFNPLPETENFHVLGESSMIWGNGRMIPGELNTPVSVIWRRNDSCVF